ncbi:hypothetical protein QFZ82_000423 [Streptomyces sp. V4I23]|uniref:hypothetical protein n=1 Tax=Streptomyces sp. V4I23 TaxID=3042282 RepID=UPI00278A77C9|nr:hypothetical protein [Streptomyces sp. V4I23]MDQ1005938.1 hypothetical protein [Streptomyces sp. V4I23]
MAQAPRLWGADRRHGYETVTRWTALAEKSDDLHGIEDFQRYMLEARAAREAGATWPEEGAA